ncbi:hypothetical protein V1517DRAFT_328539 [Lipomyces orientalis]|uniref:Uncharacterized protein n=1 Tax=Lipomyces orientalis TaxID=1233043 RepID=A0ACC3THY2_9ASCO
MDSKLSYSSRPSSSSSVEELSESSRVSDQSSTPLANSQSLSLWSHFTISYLPGKLWYPMRGKKGPIEDSRNPSTTSTAYFCLCRVMYINKRVLNVVDQRTPQM